MERSIPPPRLQDGGAGHDVRAGVKRVDGHGQHDSRHGQVGSGMGHEPRDLVLDHFGYWARRTRWWSAPQLHGQPAADTLPLTEMQITGPSLPRVFARGGKEVKVPGCRGDTVRINVGAPPPSVSLPFPGSSSASQAQVSIGWPASRCRRLAMALKRVLLRMPI